MKGISYSADEEAWKPTGGEHQGWFMGAASLTPAYRNIFILL